MSIYQRGKSWYYDFQSRGERYAGCIGQVSKTVAKEVLARKKAEAAEGRYSAPTKKQSPFFAGHRLADISPFLIEKYKRLRKEANRSEVTINRELAFLKNMFTMAIKW